MSIFSKLALGRKPTKNIGHPVLCLGSGADGQHWLLARTATQRILVEGDAGSGKTEFLLSSAWQTMLCGAPVVVIDGSASPTIPRALRTFAGMIGRADDVTVLDLDPHRCDDGIAGDRLDIWSASFDRRGLAQAILFGKDNGDLVRYFHGWLEEAAMAYRAGDREVRLSDLAKAQQSLSDEEWAVLVQAVMEADRAIGHLIARPGDSRRSSVGCGRPGIVCIRLPQDDLGVRGVGAALVNLLFLPAAKKGGPIDVGMTILRETGDNHGLAGLVAFDEVEADAVSRSFVMTAYSRALGLGVMVTTPSQEDCRQSDWAGRFTTSVRMGTVLRHDDHVVPGQFKMAYRWAPDSVKSGRGFLVSTIVAPLQVAASDRLAWAPGD